MFLLYQWQRPVTEVVDNEIFVTSGDVSRLLTGFEKTWQGNSLAKALKSWRRHSRRKNIRKEVVLPDLNPI